MNTVMKKLYNVLASTMILGIGLTIGLLYLLAEPLSTTYQFYGGRLDLYLESVPPMEMWTRVAIVIVFSMFSAFAQLLFIRQRHIQRQLQRSEQMAQQSNRLATVGEMASGIAHEINNPLTSILGYSELLLRQDVPENIRPDLEMIHNSAAKVAQIEKRLLAFSRQQKPERTLVDVNQLIATTLDLRSYAIKNNNIQVETKLAENLPWIVTDPSQLQQVLVNVIMNAETEMKNAHNGGVLNIVSELDARHIRIRVSDDGGGIDKANLERIFDPFFTTREVGQGTGLGLSVCHGIISEHNGRIYAQNRRGHGASFIIELPVAVQAMQLAMETVTGAQAANTVPAGILVVDDEPSIRDFMKKVMEGMGHRVDTAANGELALDLIGDNHYDLLMLDIKMPGMNGVELYYHLKKTRPDMVKKIIFVTGDILGAGTREFIDQVKSRHITKPISIRKLEHCLNRAFSDGI